MPTLQTDQAFKIDRRSNLSWKEFDNEYLKKNLPVIITDATVPWRARDTWNLDFLKEKYGKKLVRCRGMNEDIELQAYIDQVLRSTVEKPTPYLRNLNIQTDFPELTGDITPRVIYTSPDWMSSRLLPDGFPKKRLVNQLFISGRGTTIVLHYDDWMSHNFISNVMGVKHFTIFHQSDTPYLYPRSEDPLLTQIPNIYTIDLAKYPLYSKATPIEFDLGPQESLFIPCGWWHATQTKETCISVSSSFVAKWNWPDFRREMTKIARVKKKRPLLAVALSAYLMAVGGLLNIRYSLFKS